MSFRLRISVVFTLLVGFILALFGAYVYVHAEGLREREFDERLRERTDLALHFVHQAERMAPEERAKLENTLLASLPDEYLVIYDAKDKPLFMRSGGDAEVPATWLATARRNGVFSIALGERQFRLEASRDPENTTDLVAMASAVDRAGVESLYDLRRGLMVGSVLMLLLTAALAWGYASWTLVPVRHVVRTAAQIKSPSDRIPIPDPHRNDELGEIATTFNDLLSRLEDAFEVQRSFIAGASHELRTPLTVVRGELHQAMQMAEGQAELQAKLRLVQDQALEIQDMLSQLLWLARTQSSADQLPKDLLRLDELADRAMDQCRMRYPDRALGLSMTAANEDLEPLVKGNAVLLTAALYNLLSNAAKYGGDGPVRLSIDTTGMHVTASVSDDGPGMTEEMVARAKQLFYRSEGTQHIEGHGIGLALVERIAHVHQGRFDLRTAPGRGTVVCLQLPAVQ